MCHKSIDEVVIGQSDAPESTSNFAQPTEQVCRLRKVCVANARLSL